MKKVSIISVNYNNAAGLKKTITSLVGQTYKNFEYIIIDGASTDSSLQIIEEYKPYITHWVSEKDNGIYHAMNKGIAAATGEYLLMLNSGDFFTGNEMLENIFLAKPDSDIIYTDILADDNGTISERRHPDKISFQFFRDDFLSHQATFIRRTLHETAGLYDESLKVVADWKFMLLAICKYNASYVHIPIFVAQYDVNGFSNSAKGKTMAFNERTKVLEEEFSPYLADYADFDRTLDQLNRLNGKIYIRATKRVNRLFKSKRNDNNV